MADPGDVRTCFIISPFHKKLDPAAPKGRREIDFDKICENIVKPAIRDLAARGLAVDEPRRSDDVEQAGLIHERMIRSILEADIAIVDLTTANPNVYYELGVRHALRDRVTVLLRRAGTTNPFNIAGMTTIEYETTPARALLARRAITNFVANGLMSGSKDSLVYTMIPELKLGVDPKPVSEAIVEHYAVDRAPGRVLGIFGGDLRDVNLCAALREQPIEVWVNSENTGMQMARPYERAISGLIRHLGAEREQSGAMTKDTIAFELAAAIGTRQLVNPNEVVATGAGALEVSHRVRRIFHAASVYGVVGGGWFSVAGVEQCITNSLMRLDQEAETSADPDGAPKSILFPLLGTGTARADVFQNARRQIDAAIAYLRSRGRYTHVERVYFLAPDHTRLAGLRVALAERKARRLDDPAPAPAGDLARLPGSAPARSRRRKS